jgi:hypothetical protein
MFGNVFYYQPRGFFIFHLKLHIINCVCAEFNILREIKNSYHCINKSKYINEIKSYDSESYTI